MESVLVERKGPLTIVTINRPQVRNAVDRHTAELLAAAFREFEGDATAKCAILCGAGGNFCAGADLSKVNNRMQVDGDGPMGISRMALSKPLICAISGYAVAGGLELALLGDIRICEEEAVLGVFCRRFGVPLIDGGTVRLPRIIGRGPALDLILTGRAVSAKEAQLPQGQVLEKAQDLARLIISMPEKCMLNDRRSVYEQENLTFSDAMKNEFRLGLEVVQADDFRAGPQSFAQGKKGRHGQVVMSRL